MTSLRKIRFEAIENYIIKAIFFIILEIINLSSRIIFIYSIRYHFAFADGVPDQNIMEYFYIFTH